VVENGQNGPLTRVGVKKNNLTRYVFPKIDKLGKLNVAEWRVAKEPQPPIAEDTCVKKIRRSYHANSKKKIHKSLRSILAG
jgi:hypothetical protein